MLNQFVLGVFSTIAMGLHHPVVTPPVSTPPNINYNYHDSKTLIANGSVSDDGKTGYIHAEFPEDGGVVHGTISGDCSGTFDGYYSGEKTKQLTGTAYASCKVFFFDVPGTAQFNGTINDNNTCANVNYTASVFGRTKSGTIDFSISK